MATHWELMRDVIPTDHARQVNSVYYVDQAMTSEEPPDLVLDLGCGTGERSHLFRRHHPNIHWVGIDITGTPESTARGHIGNVVVYDGVRLPFPDGTFPLVYSHQVLEHVRHPDALLCEVARVLRRGGLFIGSTSQLEPYHSLSLWNFTLHGFRRLVEDAGLAVEEVRPSLDALTLIRRAYAGRGEEWDRYFEEESPLNAEINEWAATTGRRAQQVNNRKLEYCGQFAFRVRRPASGGGAP